MILARQVCKVRTSHFSGARALSACMKTVGRVVTQRCQPLVSTFFRCATCILCLVAPYTSHTDINIYPPGTCFKRVIVGHSTAFSVSYFLPLRGSILRRFRDQFPASFGLTQIYTKAAADQPADGRSRQQHHVINLYRKTQGLTGVAWQNICEYAGILAYAIPGASVHCVDLSRVRSPSVQMQLIAAATIHLIPHGGLSYALTFSKSGSAAVVLVDYDRDAREMHIIGHLPWVNVAYLHRSDEHLLVFYALRAAKMAQVALDMRPQSLPAAAASMFLQDSAREPSSDPT